MNPNIPEPPAIVRAVDDLAGLLAAAGAEHEAGQRAERASLEHYRKAGAALSRAKAAAGHGRWLTVLKEQSQIPQQRASEYMRLAEGWDKLPPGGSFGLKEALRIIAGESPEDAAAATTDGEPQAVEPAPVPGGVRIGHFVFTKVGLLVEGEPTFKEFLGIGHMLAKLADHHAAAQDNDGARRRAEREARQFRAFVEALSKANETAPSDTTSHTKEPAP